MLKPSPIPALSLALLFGLASADAASAATWDIDTSHSEVGFTVRHLVVAKVRGRFNEWSGKVVLDEKDITKSSVDVSIQTASIDTGTPKRDDHLRSADFFEAAKFPTLTFKSTKVEKGKEPSTLKVTGDLTIRGVTKSVVLDVSGPSPEFKDPGGNPHVAFSATTKINRRDFGLNWSKAVEAGPVAGEEVNIELEVELKNKK
jgi:polyisoprenoid-binding protein YceI